MKLSGFLLLLAVSIQPAFSGAACAQSKTLYGELDAKARVFRFVITVDEKGGAKLKSLDEGNQEFVLDDFSLNDDQLKFELKASSASFDSSLDKKSGSYQGKWKQRGQELPLDFRVVDKVPADSAKEIWEGALNVFGQKLVLRFRIYDREKQPVLMDSPDQRAGGFTGTIEKKDGKVIYSIPALKGKFEGTLSSDKQTLKGTWTQGAPLPMELKKVSATEMKKDAAPPKRPQTPKAPFPYSSSEVSISNEEAGVTLAGTLTVPRQGDQFPCVILISGSGPQDRDETIMEHKPFWVLADHLGRHGIACLRFDDRGTAKSTGDHSQATSTDFASDVSAIVDFLKKQARVNPDQIGLCGHSEGGLIAPMVASKRNDVAFVVMLAGPGVNGEKILKNQLVLILKASGAGDKEIEVAKYLQKLLIEKALTQSEIGKDEIEATVEQLIKRFPEQQKEKDALVTNVTAGAKRLSTPWMKFFLTYEPGPALAKLKCPVLVLNGSKDTQVDPKLNLPAIRQAFESAGKSNYKTMVLDELNHLFQKCEKGSIAEYQSIEETFSPVALNAITSWIHNQTAAK